MDLCTTFIVRFLDGSVQEHLNFSIKDVVRMYSTKHYALGKEPILISSPDKDLKLYYDAEKLSMYMKNEISYSELYDELWCDGLYRNIMPLKAEKRNDIEQNSLWLNRSSKLILIDNDRNVTTALNSLKQFEKIV